MEGTAAIHIVNCKNETQHAEMGQSRDPSLNVAHQLDVVKDDRDVRASVMLEAVKLSRSCSSARPCFNVP